jgi:hypothetical protein
MDVGVNDSDPPLHGGFFRLRYHPFGFLFPEPREVKMKLRNGLVALLSLATLSPAFAFDFRPIGEPSSTLAASNVSVPIYSRAELNVGGTSYPMTLTGAGLLRKKIGPFQVNVYLCSSYTDLPGGLDHQNPLVSLAGSKARALQITLVRKVTADELQDEFRKSLKINNVDPEEASIKRLMSQLTDDLSARQVFTLVGYQDVAQEKVEIEMPQQNLESEGPTVVQDIWKMWFGTPEDAGAAALKDQLIGKRRVPDALTRLTLEISPEF